MRISKNLRGKNQSTFTFSCALPSFLKFQVSLWYHFPSAGKTSFSIFFKVDFSATKSLREFLYSWSVQFNSVQWLSRVWLFVTPWIAARQPPCPSPTPGVHWDSHPSSQWCHPAIWFCRPLLLLPPIPPSIRVFSNESTLCMRWPKYWSFSFSIIPSKEIPGLISLRID